MEVFIISTFSSKYFGWLASLLVVLAAGWFLLPTGYVTLVEWLAPVMGNYVRPTFVMVNILVVNQLGNLLMVAIWIIAGLVGGIMSGTKKGGILIAFLTWFSCIGIGIFCLIQFLLPVMEGTITLSLPPIPPGTSLADVLSIPLVQSFVSDLPGLLASMAGGGSGPDVVGLVMSVAVYVLSPLIIAIIAGIVGAILRPKEEF
ncbi:MAG: hypothetical protein E3J82_00025 [Candidatus Thorarchaeota archaeon]|nr:MAG: hypothetical protein E3J82_00025 [Candidatus Thorarchaeota archaeon]